MKWPWTRSEERAAAVTQRDLELVEWFGVEEHFGQMVNAVRAEWLSAVSASIDAIAGTLASLPCYVYRVSDTGREEDDTHPLALLIRDGFNANMTWPDGIQWLAAECLRHGNAVAEKVMDPSTGRLAALRPLPWPCLVVKILTTGRLVYEFTDPINGQRRRLLDTEVLHLRDRSDDGLLGRARSERASPVIAAALALSSHAGNIFKNGAFPSGIVTVEGKIDQPGIDRLKAQFKELFAGPARAGKVMILPSAKFEGMSGTPHDQELILARRFAIEEAARLYQVPPMIVGDLSHGSFTNSETLIRFFAQSTISTWCRKVEAEFHRSVFSTTSRRSHRFVLDLSGLLRGDPETRWKSHEIALRNKVLTPNEVREEEGWNPRPGGDQVGVSPAVEPPKDGA